jgi:hypothetical protein
MYQTTVVSESWSRDISTHLYAESLPSARMRRIANISSVVGSAVP